MTTPAAVLTPSVPPPRGLNNTATAPNPLDDDRVILHFDYDCFYASVFENENPALKSLPLGVKQKSILATCNYVARARGVTKLMLISDAQRLCPELVLVNGEDLTRFRNVSKRLWRFLRDHSWNNRVERLGLDEVFMDVSDIVAYNQALLNQNSLQDSFFHLSAQDPEKGFSFDATRYYGCVHPSTYNERTARLESHPLGLRFVLASHLAGYLRRYIEGQFGYTSSGGIAVNKTLAKLAGSVNKPKNQTTIMPYLQEDIQKFVDSHKIRKVPGIGFRIGQLIQDSILSIDSFKNNNSHDETVDAGLTIADVRMHQGMSKALLCQILERPGAEKAGGDKIWNLLHGVDPSEVKSASDVPSQISIEDTYMSRPLNSVGEILRELRSLAASLIKRLRVDLTDEDPHSPIQSDSTSNLRWIAHPRTLRLSTRRRYKAGQISEQSTTESFSRNSRSQPLPNIVFDLEEAVEAVGERLVQEALLPMFRRLNPERQGWNLALINICATNMVMSGGIGEGSAGVGRDISHMFRTQRDKLREFTVYDYEEESALVGAEVDDVIPYHQHKFDEAMPEETSKEVEWHNAASTTTTPESKTPQGAVGQRKQDEEVPNGEAEEEVIFRDDETTASWQDEDYQEAEEEEEEEDDYDDALLPSLTSNHHTCPVCGHAVPDFALAAHERFHAMSST